MTFSEVLEVERRIDAEIVAEIVAIGCEPIDESNIKPEDWLPTGDEIEDLLADDWEAV